MSKLIDAEKLDFVSYQGIPDGYKDSFDSGILYAMNLIDEQPTIDAVPVKYGYWIPTSEKMPKREKMVLVCFRWSGDEQFDIGYIDKDPDNLQLRWNFEDFELYGDEMDDVVAWMPLPKPYKMDEVTKWD